MSSYSQKQEVDELENFRETADWQEICSEISNMTDMEELVLISQSVGLETINKTKGRLCAQLAQQMYSLINDTECNNLDNFAGESFKFIPKECTIKNGDNCFDVQEIIEQKIKTNPYTRENFTKKFLNESKDKLEKCRKARNSTLRKVHERKPRTKRIQNVNPQRQMLVDTISNIPDFYYGPQYIDIDSETLKMVIKFLNKMKLNNNVTQMGKLKFKYDKNSIVSVNVGIIISTLKNNNYTEQLGYLLGEGYKYATEPENRDIILAENMGVFSNITIRSPRGTRTRGAPRIGGDSPYGSDEEIRRRSSSSSEEEIRRRSSNSSDEGTIFRRYTVIRRYGDLYLRDNEGDDEDLDDFRLHVNLPEDNYTAEQLNNLYIIVGRNRAIAEQFVTYGYMENRFELIENDFVAAEVYDLETITPYIRTRFTVERREGELFLIDHEGEGSEIFRLHVNLPEGNYTAEQLNNLYNIEREGREAINLSNGNVIYLNENNFNIGEVYNLETLNPYIRTSLFIVERRDEELFLIDIRRDSEYLLRINIPEGDYTAEQLNRIYIIIREGTAAQSLVLRIIIDLNDNNFVDNEAYDLITISPYIRRSSSSSEDSERGSPRRRSSSSSEESEEESPRRRSPGIPPRIIRRPSSSSDDEE